jgi:hypothetical protein
MKAIPGLEERLMTGSDDEITIVSELVGIFLYFGLIICLIRCIIV